MLTPTSIRRLSLAAWLALSLAGCAGSPRHADSTGRRVLTAAEQSAISQIQHMAALNGGTPSSIQYVDTTVAKAVAVVDPDANVTSKDLTAYPDGGATAILVVAQGDFSGNLEKRPPLSPAHPGHVLYMVIDSPTGFVVDWGLGNILPDLSSLGPVGTA